MAYIIDLPSRTGSIEYDEDEVQDVMDTLDALPENKAVVIDEVQDTEPKARNRARVMRAAIIAATDGKVKVKTHAVENEDGNFIPAVSIPKKDRK